MTLPPSELQNIFGLPNARIALVGSGWWATEIHISSLRQRADARLVALCDTNTGRLTAAGLKYNVSNMYTDLSKM